MRPYLKCFLLGLAVMFALETFPLLNASHGAPNVLVYKNQGGNTMVVASGGTLDTQLGSTFKLGGTAVTASASDLNSLSSAGQLVNGLSTKKMARASYNVTASAAQGGIGNHGLGVTLPANSLITGGLFQVKTQFVDAGSGTVAISCGSAAFYAAVDITGFAAESIKPITVASYMNPIDVGTSACEITAAVATASQTDGKLVLFLDYVVSE